MRKSRRSHGWCVPPPPGVAPAESAGGWNASLFELEPGAVVGGAASSVDGGATGPTSFRVPVPVDPPNDGELNPLSPPENTVVVVPGAAVTASAAPENVAENPGSSGEPPPGVPPAWMNSDGSPPSAGRRGPTSADHTRVVASRVSVTAFVQSGFGASAIAPGFAGCQSDVVAHTCTDDAGVTKPPDSCSVSVADVTPDGVENRTAATLT